ncbi:MAG: OadG family protein, partial [Tannerellaceae bacterium]|nr:OadG family protein [Tannerellaceae bacterium]
TVGMSTVFIILLIVINFGKGLIFLVNKYAPEEIISKKTTPATARAMPGGISPQTTAAIAAAVSMVTSGKGKVTKIEKI